jgi:hypothetical protein
MVTGFVFWNCRSVYLETYISWLNLHVAECMEEVSLWLLSCKSGL